MYETLIEALRNVSEYDSGYAKLMYDAADAIEEIDNKLNLWRQDKISRWIPVTERLPEDTTEVLVCSGIFAPFTEVAFYDGLWYSAWDGETEIKAVTHWMPLPSPPVEE